MNQVIDIDARRNAAAAKREGEGGLVPVVIGGVTYQLPAELPYTILERVMDPEVEIAQLALAMAGTVKGHIAAGNTDQASSGIDAIAEAIAANPGLPIGFLRALEASVAELFGEDNWKAVRGGTWSLDDMLFLVAELIKKYGVRLGESLASLTSSESGGATSKPISVTSTPSTPGASGEVPASPASLAPAI